MGRRHARNEPLNWARRLATIGWGPNERPAHAPDPVPTPSCWRWRWRCRYRWSCRTGGPSSPLPMVWSFGPCWCRPPACRWCCAGCVPEPVPRDTAFQCLSIRVFEPFPTSRDSALRLPGRCWRETEAPLVRSSPITLLPRSSVNATSPSPSSLRARVPFPDLAKRVIAEEILAAMRVDGGGQDASATDGRASSPSIRSRQLIHRLLGARDEQT